MPANDAPDEADKVTHSHRGQTSEPFFLNTWESMGKSGDMAHY